MIHKQTSDILAQTDCDFKMFCFSRNHQQTDKLRNRPFYLQNNPHLNPNRKNKTLYKNVIFPIIMNCF